MGQIMERLRVALILSLLAGAAVHGGETSHYPPGAEGIKAATLPPPGLYLKTYNVFYRAGVLMDEQGNAADVGFDVAVFAPVPRLIWVTEQKILGADFGMDIAVPLIATDLEIDALGVHDSDTGIGDILVEPVVLGWHTERLDAVFAAGFWAPTGEWSPGRPASPGKGFWTGMFTWGATYYPDEQKSWSASALCRYETNSRKEDLDVRPGDDFHIEWGIAKNFCSVWDVGVTGYCHWQVTDDGGSDVTWDRSIHDRFFSIGPEVLYFCQCRKLSVSMRYQKEFAARDRPEGHNFVLSIVKIF
jgi:hypothetical protein